MGRSELIVLAVPHALQGPNFAGFVDDASYRELMALLFNRGVDFVFEESSGRGPSIAEELANSRLKPGSYLDVDPARDERPQHGIQKDVTKLLFIRPLDSNDTCEGAIVNEQRKREELWVKRIQTKEFSKGLVICGVAHALSLAFRLLSVGFDVSEALNYIPHDALCWLPHKEKKRPSHYP